MHSLRDFAKGESFLSILMEELVKFCPVALYYYDYYFLEFPKVKRFIITTSSHCKEATVQCYLSRMSIPKTIFNAEFEQKLCLHKNLIEPTAGDVT